MATPQFKIDGLNETLHGENIELLHGALTSFDLPPPHWQRRSTGTLSRSDRFAPQEGDWWLQAFRDMRGGKK
jgi:hypothetical protein